MWSTLRLYFCQGQHLLRNPGIVDKILAAADLKPSDTAFEIGPGTGERCNRTTAKQTLVATLLPAQREVANSHYWPDAGR